MDVASDSRAVGAQREAERLGPVSIRHRTKREVVRDRSFAGQYESYLNVRGEEGVIEAWRKCCASAFTERAIGYGLIADRDRAESE